MKNTIGLLLILAIILILPSCDNYINTLPRIRQVYVLRSSIQDKGHSLHVVVVNTNNNEISYRYNHMVTTLNITDFSYMFKLTNQGHRKSIFE